MYLYVVRMAQWSKALRSGRSLVLQAWVRNPTSDNCFLQSNCYVEVDMKFCSKLSMVCVYE